MASDLPAQKRLDQIVRLIAANMVAEVCSIYIARGGEVLELFATEGLKKEAVHKTRLRFHEGLVGEIAATGEPLNLSDAQSHPKFVYREETGEEAFHSLLGVPILRAGRVVGVLVVQNKTRRHYTDDEAEALQTVAMVLAEVVGSGDLVAPREAAEATLERAATPSFEAVTFAEGVAIGKAVFHEPIIEITNHLATDTEYEKQRLEKALTELHNQIDQLISAEDIQRGGEHHEILDVYKMFAADEGWRLKIIDVIETGLTAEAAVERVQVDNRTRLMRTTDPYLRERLSDLDDLSNRLIRVLVGKPATAAAENLPDDAIVLARSMGPAELLDYDREKLRGVVLQDGSHTAHVTIVARALGIPLVGKVGSVLGRIEPGEEIIVDGENGWIYVSPSPEILQSYREMLEARTARAAEYAKLRDVPAETRDGVEVELMINAGLSIDLPHLETTGAAGIGLFRTEFQFMVGSQLPKQDAQVEFYGQVFDAARNRPVVFRTLDIGGDKPVPFMARDHEENPALGWRAMRVVLDRPALLRLQVRALLEAAQGRPLNLMFPMVTEVSEFKAGRAIIDKEVARRKALGRVLPETLRVGTMIEVPALLWQLDHLLPLTDFVSIGSNDLMQFLFAADRSNTHLAGRYDLLSPPALLALRHILDRARAHGVPVTLCGEMGGRTLEAMALIGLGLRRLSVAPAAIGPVKMMIRSLELGALTAFLDRIIQSSDHSLRNHLLVFARDHHVVL
ncbi:MAG: phosphoenolpyruvate--protein phosphotransferase [Alphaproteobacteria bacterium]|nr:MAG: phosphoenolpyruvate--protein phosphotransferase [Alphaproteobacteria bacterium]